jgi:hypothetical protein
MRKHKAGELTSVVLMLGARCIAPTTMKSADVAFIALQAFGVPQKPRATLPNNFDVS